MRPIEEAKNVRVLKFLKTRDATAGEIKSRCDIGSVDSVRGRMLRLEARELVHAARYDVMGNNWTIVWRLGPGMRAIPPRGWPGGFRLLNTPSGTTPTVDGEPRALAGSGKWPFPPAPLLSEVLGLVVLCTPPKGRFVRGAAMRG